MKKVVNEESASPWRSLLIVSQTILRKVNKKFHLTFFFYFTVFEDTIFLNHMVSLHNLLVCTRDDQSDQGSGGTMWEFPLCPAGINHTYKLFSSCILLIKLNFIVKFYSYESI